MARRFGERYADEEAKRASGFYNSYTPDGPALCNEKVAEFWLTSPRQFIMLTLRYKLTVIEIDTPIPHIFHRDEWDA